MLGIGEFRKNLSERVEAAYIDGQPTVVKHGSRRIARAVLVPFHVGTTPVPIGLKDEPVESYVVSREWFERARAALGEG